MLATLDAVYIESSYDPDMLRDGPYPWHVKNRIAGPHGHISNYESADLLRSAGSRLAWASLAHLSAVNNTPTLAYETHRQIVGQSLPVFLASREHVSDVLNV